MRVGPRQKIIQGLPGVVATGLPPLDLHDNRYGRHLPRYGDDLTDLVHGSRFERHIREPIGT